MERLILLFIVATVGWSSAQAETLAGIYGTYSNLARSRESGDLNGYEMTLVAQSGSNAAVFECAHGAAGKTVFVPVRLAGKRVSFTIRDADNDCSGDYDGVLVPGGLRLHSAVVGDTEFVPRRASFWMSSMPAATRFEKTTGPLFDRLAVACPVKKLEDMAPADLDLQIESFIPSLNSAQRKRFEGRAEGECKDSIAGVGCGNGAFLEMAMREGYLGRFVKALCASDLVCTEQPICGPANGRSTR